MKYVTVDNYRDMSKRVSELINDDSVGGSSNFGNYLKMFENEDSSWIDIINNKINA